MTRTCRYGRQHLEFNLTHVTIFKCHLFWHEVTNVQYLVLLSKTTLAEHYLDGSGVWAHTHWVSLQGECLEFATQPQILNLDQVIHIIPFQIQ